MSTKIALERKGKHYTKLFVSLSLISILLLITPSIINGFTLSGSEQHYNYRISQIISQGEKYDELSFSGRQITPPLGTYSIIALLSFNSDKVMLILPIILGLISLIFFNKILTNLKISRPIKLVSTILLIITPSYIHNFSHLTSATIPLTLMLITFYFITKESKISIPLLALIPFFGLIPFITSLILLSAYLIHKKKKEDFIKLTWLSIIIAFFNYTLLIINQGLPQEELSLFQLLTDIGSPLGINIFLISLSLIGILTLWKEKYKYLPIYITMLYFLVAASVTSNITPYLTLYLSVIASIGILRLMKGNWESPLIQRTTFVILIIGLIISTGSYYEEISEKKISTELIKALEFLKEDSSKNSIVFSHKDNGNWISSIASRKNFMDTNTAYAPFLEEKTDDSSVLFTTRNEETALELIKKHNINYILITPEMKQGITWHREEEGLLFLLKYSNAFKLKYNKDNIEVWEVQI